MAALRIEIQVESGTRARTRRAILDAAVEVLGANPSASLGEIADAAEVGRSTLHRYFPERVDLIRALAAHVMALSDAAVARAQPEHGDPVEALRRVAEEHFDLGPVLMYLYGEQLIVGDEELWESIKSADDPVDALLARVHDQLGLDLPVSWISRAFWSLLYAGWEAAKEDGMPRHQVIDAVMTTLTRGALRPG